MSAAGHGLFAFGSSGKTERQRPSPGSKKHPTFSIRQVVFRAAQSGRISWRAASGTRELRTAVRRSFRALLSRCVSFLAVDALIEAHFLGGPGNLHRRDLLNDPQHAQREQEGP